MIFMADLKELRGEYSAEVIRESIKGLKAINRNAREALKTLREIEKELDSHE